MTKYRVINTTELKNQSSPWPEVEFESNVNLIFHINDIILFNKEEHIIQFFNNEEIMFGWVNSDYKDEWMQRLIQEEKITEIIDSEHIAVKPKISRINFVD